MTPLPGPGSFAALGLPARAGLTDDEVRAAWRRIAAATHPDRTDGGDPARFAAAAAAYTALRTRSGRAEALADLAGLAAGPGRAAAGGGRAASTAWPTGRARTSLARLLVRAGGGRPAVLLLRLAASAAVAALAVFAAGWTPATAAVLTGTVTWLVLTAGRDITPPW
jgi:hypothetical protein